MKVWVQAWTAKVPSAVEIDLEDLRKISGFEDIEPMIPVMVNLRDEYKIINSHLTEAPKVTLTELEEREEVLQPWKD